MSLEHEVLPGDLKEAVELLEAMERANTRGNLSISNDGGWLLNASQKEYEGYARRLQDLKNRKRDNDNYLGLLSNLDQRGLVKIKYIILEAQ